MNGEEHPAARRALLGVAGWLAAAAVTIAAGLWALSLVESGITGSAVAPMTESQVQDALVTASPAPVPSAAGTYSTGGAFAYAAGSVSATCSGDQAVLLSWVPAPGYGDDDVKRGPAATASVSFESETETATVSVTCASGRPVASVRTEADD